ncbi:MAG: dTDP-4-dehydrorhamnose 3,5-epimerase [Myxococcales bacterium]|nr:dTDP-4-dehydrorhamnose 3,5-epimerase [Myxococcales bacterium]
MEVQPLAIPEVMLLRPRIHVDPRGYFFESYRERPYMELGIGPFVQDNVSRSTRGVLRGLHLQHPQGQGKLVHVLVGEVFDVAVDVRVGSPSFGRWVGAKLSAENKLQLWIPEGFAHGFCVLSEEAVFAYKCTAEYSPETELGVRFDDPDLAIDWPIADPLVSAKDAAHPRLRDIPEGRLPRHG